MKAEQTAASRLRRTPPRAHLRPATAPPTRAVARSTQPTLAGDVARYLANEVLNGIKGAPVHTASDGEEVVLECERDGYRVLIVREPPRRPSALNLSPREMEIARMIAKGYANKTIADVLEISSWTVGTHLRRIFAKFGVTSRAAMVARLMASGILGRATHNEDSRGRTEPPRRVLGRP